MKMMIKRKTLNVNLTKQVLQGEVLLFQIWLLHRVFDIFLLEIGTFRPFSINKPQCCIE